MSGRFTRVALLVAAFAATPLIAQAQPADLILTGARIWTGDSTRPSAAAIDIDGERILAVGSEAEGGR